MSCSRTKSPWVAKVPGADPDVYTLLYNNVFGTKMKLVTGYHGTNDIVARHGARRDRRRLRPVLEHA